MARVYALLTALLPALPSASAACTLSNFDVGGGQNACGYAKEVKVIGGPGYDFAAHSWIGSKGIPTETVATADLLDEPADCQALCEGSAECEYWVFTPEEKGRCILKEAYASTMCMPLYEASTGNHAGPKSCSAPACVQEGHDVGGSDNSCGYAPELMVYGGAGYDFSAHSWIATKGIATATTTAELKTTSECQMLCGRTANCAYFVLNAAAQGIGRCILKGAYAKTTCQPLYQASTGNDAGPVMCTPSAARSCFLMGYDVGGGGNACGYASEVKVIGGPDYDFSAHSWIASKGVPTEAASSTGELNEAADCQALCVADERCSYFVYDPTAQKKGRCILKQAYPAADCTPLYEASSEDISGPGVCSPTGCFQDGKDVGGDQNSCGYAKELMVYGGPGYDFSAHSWIASKNIPTQAVADSAELDEAADCQSLCGATQDCAYFVFQASAQNNKGRCILKAAYAEDSCQPLYQANAGNVAGPVTCTLTRENHVSSGPHAAALGALALLMMMANAGLQTLG